MKLGKQFRIQWKNNCIMCPDVGRAWCLAYLAHKGVTEAEE